MVKNTYGVTNRIPASHRVSLILEGMIYLSMRIALGMFFFDFAECFDNRSRMELFCDVPQGAMENGPATVVPKCWYARSRTTVHDVQTCGPKKVSRRNTLEGDVASLRTMSLEIY